jgi:hypothetical protein
MNFERLAALLLAVCLAPACDQPDDDPADAALADATPAPDAAPADVAAADVAAPADTAADTTAAGDATPDLAAVGLGFALPGGELYPEGIAVSRDGTFYVGSLREGLILKASPASWMRGVPFIPAGSNGLVGVLGLHADDATSTLWACSSDVPTARLAGTAPTALKAFDLASGLPKGSYDFPGGGRCNDLTVDSRGNVYATDSNSPRLLRLPRGGAALEVWLEGDVLAGYLNGITVDSRDRLYLVLSDAGGLIRFAVQPDGRPGPLERVALPRKLTGPDGVEMLNDSTAVVVESSYQFSTVAIREDAGGLQGTIHQRARVRRPTTFALYGGAAWIVEGQIVSLNNPDAGGAPLLPFVVYRVELTP